MTVCVSATLSDLTIEGDRLVYPDGSFFDMEAYSRFKYGYTAPAREYGYSLARHFIVAFPDLAKSNQRVLVTSAPYKFLPSASDSIATAFRDALNCFRVVQGLEPAMTLHTIRFKVGSDSYAQGGLAERQKSYSTMPRHVDPTLVKDSIVIFIDDVRITGSTEIRFHELILPCNPAALCTMHVAKVNQEQALEMPQIENVMNKFRPPTLTAIAADIATGDFKLNSRVFRTILEHDATELEPFLMQLSDGLLHEMFVALMSGTVEMFNRLPQGKATLHRICAKRRLPVAFIATLIK